MAKETEGQVVTAVGEHDSDISSGKGLVIPASDTEGNVMPVVILYDDPDDSDPDGMYMRRQKS